MSEQPTPAPEVKHLWAELESTGPQVGILMGSESDREVMEAAAKELDERGISFEMQALSAHRDPRGVAEYSSTAALFDTSSVSFVKTRGSEFGSFTK